MTETTTTSKPLNRALWRRWSTREILLTAILGLAFGVLFIPLMFGYVALSVLGPVFAWSTVGFWVVPAFFAGYVIRRPGAALLLMLIASLVLVPSTPYGVTMLLSGLVYGLAVEAGCALSTGYKHWSWPRLVLVGLIAGLISLAFGVFITRALIYAAWLNALIAVVCLVSNVVGVIVAKVLAEAVARTGLLSGSALGTSGQPL